MDESKYQARIAQLESEVAGLKKAATSKGIDPQELAKDPSAAIMKAGIVPTHVTDLLIAQAMGDKTPKELRDRIQVRQQENAPIAELAATVKTISQRLADQDDSTRKAAARKSFMALASDKQKYPTLAAALERDSSIFDDEVSGGDAADADRLEARYARVVAPKAPAATDSTAATATGQSSEAKATEGAPKGAEGSAGVGTAGGALALPPIKAISQSGPMTPEDDAALIDLIVKKHSH